MYTKLQSSLHEQLCDLMRRVIKAFPDETKESVCNKGESLQRLGKKINDYIEAILWLNHDTIVDDRSEIIKEIETSRRWVADFENRCIEWRYKTNEDI